MGQLVTDIGGTLRREGFDEVLHPAAARALTRLEQAASGGAPQSLDEMWDIPGLENRLRSDFALDMPIAKWLADDNKLFEEKLKERIHEVVEKSYQLKEEMVGAPVLRQFELAPNRVTEVVLRETLAERVR